MKYFSAAGKWLVYCLAVMSMTSCKKDLLEKKDDNYYIRFNFNGQQHEYKSNAFGSIQYTNGVESMIICAYKNFDATVRLQEQISLLLYSSSEFKKGSVCKDPLKVSTDDGTKMPQVIITHYDDKEQGFQTVGIFSDENGVIAGSDLIPSLKNILTDAMVTVTELTADHIRGRFSGTTYQADSWIDGVKYPVTDGEFFVKRES